MSSADADVILSLEGPGNSYGDLPGVPLFHVGERAAQLNEILPTTHPFAALNRVMSLVPLSSHSPSSRRFP